MAAVTSVPESTLGRVCWKPAENGILLPASPREEILRTWRLLVQPDDVHEVRIPKTRRCGTISGFFNNADTLANAVLPLDGTVPGIYLTLNPVNPSLLARAANRVRERAETTTSDADIVRRRWLLIDFDPVRPSGISSSDFEHGRAIAAACGAWEDLRAAGFGDPVVADSGNGAHLLYRLDLPNDHAATATVRRVLAGVAAFSGCDDIAVDVTVHNASRVVKLHGTQTCKGDHLPERPHRRSRLLEIPKQMIVLGVAL